MGLYGLITVIAQSHRYFICGLHFFCKSFPYSFFFAKFVGIEFSASGKDRAEIRQPKTYQSFTNHEPLFYFGHAPWNNRLGLGADVQGMARPERQPDQQGSHAFRLFRLPAGGECPEVNDKGKFLQLPKPQRYLEVQFCQRRHLASC